MIYHALINAPSTHMIHINLNIFYTHVEHSATQNNPHKAPYGKTPDPPHTHKKTTTMYLSAYDTNLYHTSCMRIHMHTHTHAWTHTPTQTNLPKPHYGNGVCVSCIYSHARQEIP